MQVHQDLGDGKARKTVQGERTRRSLHCHDCKGNDREQDGENKADAIGSETSSPRSGTVDDLVSFTGPF